MASDDIDSLEEELDALEGGDDRRQQIMRFLPIILAVGALLVFAVIVLIAYSGSDEEIPVAQTATLAPEAPKLKIEPENPGGMEIPDQDKQVYNQMGQSQADTPVENILQPPELPQNPPKAAAEPQDSTESGATRTTEAERTPPPPPDADAEVLPAVPQTPAPDAPSGAAESGNVASGEGADGNEPTGSVAAGDGATGDNTGPAEPVGEGASASATVPAVIPEPPSQASAPSSEDTKTAAAQPPEPGILQQPAKPAERQAPAKPEAVTQMRTMEGVYRVQVASLKSQNQAEAAWKEQVQRYPELLSDLSLTVQRAVLAGKGTYYRVQIGPFSNRDAADSLCRKLKSRGQDCLVVRP